MSVEHLRAEQEVWMMKASRVFPQPAEQCGGTAQRFVGLCVCGRALVSDLRRELFVKAV